MNFLKIACVTCKRSLLASAELEESTRSTLACMLCQPARYPFCKGCQLPLYVSQHHEAPEYCSDCRGELSTATKLDTQRYLEGFIEDSSVPRRVALNTFPCTVGRSSDCTIQINRPGISRNHARFDMVDDQVQLTDLNSTNGTFVERSRISKPILLNHGDVIHFADYEFRLLEIGAEIDIPQEICETMVGDSISPLSAHFPTKMKEFTELLEQGMVQGYRQVIVDQHGAPIGYELLGRGSHPELSESPSALFTLAHALDLEVKLSELFRRHSLADANAEDMEGLVFINTHPKECQDVQRLLQEFRELRERYPLLSLVCEIHEAAVTDLRQMAEIRSGLQELGIRFAYDDFGAGQARLLELVQVPPDILKFDYALITGLTSTEAPAYQLVKTLTELVRKTGIKTLAEGVESEAVMKTCRALGIDYIQGFYYGRPEPIISAQRSAVA